MEYKYESLRQEFAWSEAVCFGSAEYQCKRVVQSEAKPYFFVAEVGFASTGAGLSVASITKSLTSLGMQ